MKVLVTGASGFIGKNLLLKLPKQWQVYGTYFHNADFKKFLKSNKLKAKAVKCNLANAEEVKKLANIVGKVDVCIYLAANSDPKYSCTHVTEDWKANLLSLLNFLDNVRCKRLIFFSSGAVYDGLKGKVFTSSKLNPKLPYAITKLASEYYIRFYHEMKKIDSYTIIRFFGAYGPYEPERKITTRLIKELHLKNKSEYEIYGDGTNLIDLIYIDDVVACLINIVKSNKSETVNFGSGNPLTINAFVTKIGKIFGKKVKIKHKGKAAEPIKFYASSKEIKKLGFKQKITLEEGIKRLSKHLKNL